MCSSKAALGRPENTKYLLSILESPPLLETSVSQAAANYLQEINLEFLLEVIILHLSRLSCGRCWPGRYNNCQSLSETGNKPCLPPLSSVATLSQGHCKITTEEGMITQLPLQISLHLRSKLNFNLLIPCSMNQPLIIYSNKNTFDSSS